MYCPNCGRELAKNTKFCAYCGKKIDVRQPAEPSFIEKEQSDFRQTSERQDLKQGRTSHNGNRWWQILLVIIICAAAVAVFLFARPVIQERQFSNHMEIGRNYMNEGSYDEAVTEFLSAIEIDPKAVPAYEQLAESYIKLDEPELAEDAYQDGRDVILDSYEESGLLDGAEDFYEAAIAYYGEKGDSAEVTDLVDEITGMLTDEKQVENIKQLGELYIDGEDDSEEEMSDEVKPSEEQVEALLEKFKDWADNMLGLYYSAYVGEGTDDLSNYEAIDAPEAYAVAALALREDRDAPQGDPTYYLDGNFYTLDEYNAMSMDLETDARSYIPLSTSYYEEYLQNLFGEEYSLDDFKEYEDQVNDTVIEGEDGQFYVRTGDYINEGVDISIVDFSDTPDENGLYTVIAEYTTHWVEGPDSIDYMQYQIAPDGSSAYGCRIAGMVPAGDGEIDPESSVEDTYDEENASTEDVDWQNLYADYIEANHFDGNEALYKNYTAIYINDDNVPELCCLGKYGSNGNPILYIQDGEVKDYDGAYYGDLTYAVRGGYIYYFGAHMGSESNTLAYLNENNELEVQANFACDIFSDPKSYSINNEQVSQETYEEEAENIKSQVENESYDWESPEDPFAADSSEAVQKLRSGEAASIIGQ